MGRVKTRLVKRVIEVGLRLPNGNIVWPPKDYNGYAFQTPEERQRLLEAIASTEASIGFDQGALLRYFSWTQRTLSCYSATTLGSRYYIHELEDFDRDLAASLEALEQETIGQEIEESTDE